HPTHSPTTLPPPYFSLNHPPTTELYTLSLHDALPIWDHRRGARSCRRACPYNAPDPAACGSSRAPPEREPRHWFQESRPWGRQRSEEHTSELQSLTNLVCRLLLEKKNKRAPTMTLSYI